MDARSHPVLIDRYELGELLGSGGMGQVYVGHDRVLGRRVAIKLVAGGGVSSQPELTQRLRSEARAAASIEHPNVVRVHDLTITDASIFVVMEYLEGETLRARLRREKSLPSELAIGIGADVCLGLAAAHQAGVVHRDIGPGNIMLGTDGTVKVMDFGIARVADSTVQTAPGQTVGTPAYLSPEQAGGAAVDARSDLYSLGCTLYHMVTGQPPFTGASPVEVAWQQRHATPRPPSVLAAGLTPALETVILTAMAKAPGERFGDALQMRAQLIAALTQSHDASEASVVQGSPSGATASTMPMAQPRHRGVNGTDSAEPPGSAERTEPPGPAEPAELAEPAQPVQPPQAVEPVETDEPVPPTRTYQPAAHVDPAELDAADLPGAAADRRRRRAGVALVLVALAVIGIALLALLTPPA